MVSSRYSFQPSDAAQCNFPLLLVFHPSSFRRIDVLFPDRFPCDFIRLAYGWIDGRRRPFHSLTHTLTDTLTLYTHRMRSPT